MNLAIVGPIGSGTHAVAMGLARKRDSELIGCDSVHVYRGFSIGSAKAIAADREEIPHHLLDVVGWKNDFDTAAYVDNARRALQSIEDAGKTPIIYGGTGLYLRALRYGLGELPPTEPALRKTLQAEAKSDLPALVERLRANDPESAETIDTKNPVAVIRALEIFET
ncbi:tRNA (adenosine(37)-N6)-dimethylallyltransferase, partial [Myxococcota bacterium]